MKKLDSITNTLYLLLLVVLGIVISMDIASVISNPDDYRIPHRFSGNDLSWRSPDVFRYILQDLVILFVIIFLALLGVRKMTGKLKNKLWIWIYYVGVIFVFVVFVFGYVNWARTGFDH